MNEHNEPFEAMRAGRVVENKPFSFFVVTISY